MEVGILLYASVSDTGTEPLTKRLLEALCPLSWDLKPGHSNNKPGQDLIVFFTRRITT